MNRKILSILLSFVIFFGTVPIPVYAQTKEAFALYQEVMRATTASGNWTEEVTMTADMIMSDEHSEIKTKVTLTSSMDVSNYLENNLSDVKISGTTSMKALGQVYEWETQYENGVAHYNYIQPQKTSVDIEVDPNCFNFYAITSDMIKREEIFENKIKFTFSGEKMKNANIVDMNFLQGMENINFGDTDVEVIIDETGIIDSVVMNFHASLMYQGYAAEMDYHINYKFLNIDKGSGLDDGENKGEIGTEIENGLLIFSDSPNLCIPKEGKITLGVGSKIDGKQVEDVSGINFLVEDSSVLSFIDTKVRDNRRYITLKGNNVGTTHVVFQDAITGYTARVPVTVYKSNYLSYTLSSVPQKYIEKYPTNIYNFNGLYVDNYGYSINDNLTAKVHFDVYNTNYSYGAVESYKSDGTLYNVVIIDKMDSNSSGFKEAVWDNFWCLARDWDDKDFGTYRQESGYSKQTKVEIEIPENGYIKICTDSENSSIVGIVNSVDILMQLGESGKKISAYDNSSKEFAKAITTELLTDITYKNLVKDGSDFSKKLWKGVIKETAFSSEAIGNFCDTVLKNIDELNLSKLIGDTAIDFGWEVTENVFSDLSGVIGKVLDGLFFLGKHVDISRQYCDLISGSNKGSIYIQNQGGGFRSAQQIIIKSDKGFSDDTALNVFQATLDSRLLDILKKSNPDIYEKIIAGRTYTYNISLMKNEEEIQPDGKVAVHIPIPRNLKIPAYIGKTKIYRVEEDGTLTAMDVRIKDGYFVFETTHFSLYTIMGDDWKSIAVIAGGFISVVSAVSIFVLCAWKKRTRKYKMRKEVQGVICPICQNEIKEDAKFCTKCGNKIPRCPTCNKVLYQKARFCTNDGTPLPEELFERFSDSQEDNSIKKQKPKRKKRQMLIGGIFLFVFGGGLLGYAIAGDKFEFLLKNDIAGTEIESDEKLVSADNKYDEEDTLEHVKESSEMVEEYLSESEIKENHSSETKTDNKVQSREESAMTVQESQNSINNFLSYFSEQWFGESTMEIFESKKADPMDMIAFACLYLKINDNDTIDFLSYNDHEYVGFSIELIDSVTQRFFGRTVTLEDVVPIPISENYYNYIVLNDMVCFVCEDGKTYNHMTLAKELYDLGNETMRVEFNIYSIASSNYNFVTPGCGIKDKNVYNYTLEEAEEHSDFELYGCGTAVVKPYITSSGMETYQLISYRTDRNKVQSEMDPLEYFIINCDKMCFTKEDLSVFDEEMCRKARNGIYARMGRKFQDESLSMYFSQYDWYMPTIEADEFSESLLNGFQIVNRDLIIAYEKENGYSQAINVEVEVQEIRKLYYDVQNNIDQYERRAGDEGITRYLDENGNIVKISTEKGSYMSFLESETYAAEFYYEITEQGNRPRFVFIFGRNEEYRIYLTEDGTCIRYIDAAGEVHNYENPILRKELSKITEMYKFWMKAEEEILKAV